MQNPFLPGLLQLELKQGALTTGLLVQPSSPGNAKATLSVQEAWNGDTNSKQISNKKF